MPAPMMMITSVALLSDARGAGSSAGQRCARIRLPRRGAMHVARELLHALDRRARQDAVPEIEDMSRTAVGPPQHVVRRAEHAIRRTQQQRRIEVALDAAIGAD